MDLSTRIKEAKDIVDRAIAQYSPDEILLGFTGGSDSLVLFHVIQELGYDFRPFFCNVGIGVEEQWEFIRRHCAEHDRKLIEQGPTYKLYKQIIIQNGFPGPSMHGIIYNDLKEKSIRHISKFFEWKTIVLTGVRISESERRKINISADIQKKDGDKIVWVSPIINWDDDDKDEYLDTRKIERSPVSQRLGMSYECGCGAYAKPGEKKMVSECYPAFGKLIDALQETLFAIGFTWGWDDPLPEGKDYYEVMEKIYPGYTEMKLHKSVKAKNDKKKQPDLFMPMCHKCEYSHNLSVMKIQAGFSSPGPRYMNHV